MLHELKHPPALLRCQWQLNQPLTEACPCRTLDLIVVPVAFWPRESSPDDLGCLGSGIGEQLLGQALRQNIQQFATSITAAKLLLPNTNGYPIRDDLLQRRFLTCQLAEKVVDRTPLAQQISPFDFDTNSAIVFRALKSAIGGILLAPLPGLNNQLVRAALKELETEVAGRLSFRWIVPNALPRKRIAMIDGRPNPAQSTASRGIYSAAQALGIDLVVLDHEGHWVQDPAMGILRDEFIACDLKLDDNLADRIVDALSTSKGPINGITTFTDTHILVSALAARKMGLHANPPESLELCRDKRKTRSVASADLQVLSIAHNDDLTDVLGRSAGIIRYPIIVKPSTGSSSDGVSKVECEAELRVAVQRNLERFPGVNALVEPYISGPEVDANFVLLDGNLAWSEINDDFPCTAETISTASTTPMSFVEMSTIMPSILPESEVAMVKSSLTNLLLRMGFRNGVYHLEARVKDSRKHYANTLHGVDLIEIRETDSFSSPSTFLIEINPRLPGHQESFAVEFTYGLDYFALHMLLATAPSSSGMQTAQGIAFSDAVRALSSPLDDAVQYPSHIVFIPAERGGTFRRAKLPPDDLMKHIPRHAVFLEEGEVVPDPLIVGKWPFVAYFLVVGRMTGAAGREEVRTIGEMVRQAFTYELD